jgi:hypothetical protein
MYNVELIIFFCISVIENEAARLHVGVDCYGHFVFNKQNWYQKYK